MDQKIVIVSGVRTPFAKAFTDFNDVPAKELARVAFAELLQRTELDPSVVDEVILGTVATTSDAANIARVVSLLAGVPERRRAVTVSRNCASGIEAVTNAYEKIMTGLDSVILAGGAESMSNVPLTYKKSVQDFFVQSRKASLLEKAAMAWKVKKDFFSPVIGLQQALTDPVCGLNMGQTAEVLAKEFGITRDEEDRFALESHRRAAAGRARLAEEIVPVYPGPDYRKAVTQDNGVRENQSLEELAKLRPVFDPANGTVTAGNSSQVTDGACALLIMKEERARELGFQPLGFIRSYAYEGLDPRRMGLGPAYAIPTALKKAGAVLSDIELIEINEAFAAQVIACERALASDEFCRNKLGLSAALGKIDRSKLNVNGGAIALGHPVGTTGSRLILTLLLEMKRRGLGLGLVSLCVGGGLGAAVVLERI